MPSDETPARRRQVVAVAGEAVADLVADQPAGAYVAVPGGSPANVAVGLTRLGTPTRMVARIGADPLGRTLRDHLTANGVGTETVVTAHEPSSLALVHHDADGVPSFDLRIQGTADWQWTEEEAAGLRLGDLAALHVGSLALVMPPGADVLAALARRMRSVATISYDPNCRPAVIEGVPDARVRVEALLRLADVVKLSDADLDWLRPGCGPEELTEELLSAGVSVVAVTYGARGSIVAGRRCPPRRVPAYRVDVVDTVGAGDSYMSAVLAGLGRRGLLGAGRRDALAALDAPDLVAVFDEAARAAALTCSRRGADPPTRAELDAFHPTSG
ncbi:carbohydrate kinase family protein [Actinoallomurus iriomotensis]|uniref:Fructokinase n=1 Tax=Actinoallomurus iriomotensis TaxID=478107 RepID=A0A9W6REF9_9ACTN|nr:carbohydrate kinase [Actinoallomurus iriomotensis]GLY74268.1 fructokinase [Actinoallomurus iriomotensis]